jgi:hypothetical protein
MQPQLKPMNIVRTRPSSNAAIKTPASLPTMLLKHRSDTLSAYRSGHWQNLPKEKSAVVGSPSSVLAVSELYTNKNHFDALKDLVQDALNRAPPETDGKPDIVIACHSNTVVVETLQWMDSLGVEARSNNRLLDPESQAVKSFLNLIWGQAVQYAISAGSNQIAKEDNVPDESFAEAHSLSRHVYRILVSFYGIPTFKSEVRSLIIACHGFFFFANHSTQAEVKSNKETATMIDDLSDLFCHHAIFKRPLENVLAAASRHDEFVQTRLRQRSKVSALTKATEQLKESVRAGYGRKATKEDAVVEEKPQDSRAPAKKGLSPPPVQQQRQPYPDSLLQLFGKFTEDVQSVLQVLHDTEPSSAVSAVLERVIALAPASMPAAIALDWRHMGSVFEKLVPVRLMKNSGKGFKFTGNLAANSHRLQQFLRLSASGHLAALPSLSRSRVSVVAMNQLPASLRASLVIIREPPRPRSYLGPQVTPYTHTIPSISGFALNNAATLWALDFMRCANIATQQVVILPNAGDPTAFSMLAKLGIRYIPFSSDQYRSLFTAGALQPPTVGKSRTPIPIFGHRSVDAWNEFLSFTHLKLFANCPLSVRIAFPQSLSRPC